MPKEQSGLEATQEEVLALTEEGLADVEAEMEGPTQEGKLSNEGVREEDSSSPRINIGNLWSPSEKKIAGGPEVGSGVNLGEAEESGLPTTPEVVELKTPEETVSPESQEDVVERFSKQANERVASLTVAPEADETERAELEKLMAEKDKIEAALARPKALLQEKEETEQALREFRSLEDPVKQEDIYERGSTITRLEGEKERLEKELEAARKEKEAWIGTPERASQTQNTYEGLEMAISEEEERLLKQNEAQREQYEEEKQAAQEAKQRLAVWQNYLENETEIRGKEEDYENRIKVLSEERERASTEEEKALYAKRRGVRRGQLTRLRKKIPQDIDGFEGEPKNEIEGMYRETVREMRREEVETEKPAEEPTVGLSEEEKAVLAKGRWQVVIRLVTSEGAFKKDLTEEEKEALGEQLASLEELGSYPEKINQLRLRFAQRGKING